MKLFDLIEKYQNFDFESFFQKQDINNIKRVISKNNLEIMDYLTLLSPQMDDTLLEEMAQKANQITKMQFGNTVSIFAPMYLSNICINNCKYCGFRRSNEIPRKKLTTEEIIKEAKKISEDGIKHVLLLTGESYIETPVEYIINAVKSVKKYFNSISIEIYPMDKENYIKLVEAGIDGITIFQETYHKETYANMHEGPKSDFIYRLDTTERAAEAKMRTISIGALLGLYSPYFDSLCTAIHAKYLMDKYPECEVSVSFPRIRPEIGGFKAHSEIDDKLFVQFITAMRLFLHRVSITISTREDASLRDNLIGLGVTKISAGSKTDVGGYTLEDKSTEQFEISDSRTIKEISEMLYKKGHMPIFTDWIS